jgi:hypothetical protein
MIKIIMFILLSSITNSHLNNIQPLDQKMPGSTAIKNAYKQNGFTTINKVVSQFEETNHRTVLLPGIQPYKDQFYYGKYDNENNILYIDYFNLKGIQLVEFFVWKAKPIELSQRKFYVLSDQEGTRAYICYNPISHGIEFNKDGLHYTVLTSNKSKLTDKDLIKLANSMSK